MNKSIILVVVQFLFANHLFAQCEKQFQVKYKIRYNIEYVYDSLNEREKDIYDYDLFSGDRCSFYGGKYQDIQHLIKRLEKPNYIDYFLIKDKSLGVSKSFVSISWDGEYVNSDNKTVFNWFINDDLKMIGNYMCKRATTHFRGRNWTAWFTEEIPISDGPYKFYGLPGLIIDISDDKNHIRYRLVKFEEFETTTVEINHKYHEVDMMEFLHKIENNGSSAYSSKGFGKFIVRINGGEEEDITPKPIKLKNLIELTDENGKRIVLK